LSELADGQPLDAIEGKFDLLVRMDRSLLFQQRLHGRGMVVPVLVARSNRRADLLPLAPKLLMAPAGLRSGEAREIS
jgi:hypothetical protein